MTDIIKRICKLNFTEEDKRLHCRIFTTNTQTGTHTHGIGSLLIISFFLHDYNRVDQNDQLEKYKQVKCILSDKLTSSVVEHVPTLL